MSLKQKTDPKSQENMINLYIENPELVQPEFDSKSEKVNSKNCLQYIVIEEENKKEENVEEKEAAQVVSYVDMGQSPIA